MKNEELFMGFSIGAGKDRFNDGFNRYGTTIDCKVSGKDTGGAMCVLEVNNTGWPRHLNRDQDEWIYVVDGEVELEIGKKRCRLGTLESMFIPRNIEHTWAAVSVTKFIVNRRATATESHNSGTFPVSGSMMHGESARNATGFRGAGEATHGSGPVVHN